VVAWLYKVSPSLIQKDLVASNFAYPLWEIPAPKSKRVFDSFNMRFDGWWRIHVTKLMELDKIREERPNWLRLKELNKKK
jgi:hypothetical protein